MTRSLRRTYLLFGALTFYVLLQFLWWAFLLMRKESEVAELALHVQALGGTTSQPTDATRAMRMVVGEGAVFITLLIIMLILTFRGLRRELALARSQRNFLMAVTHELRTPLAAIKLQLQTIGRPGINTEQRDTLNREALSEADRLSVLADKVLLATSAEEGILAVDLKPVDVMQLLADVVRRAEAQIATDHVLELQGPAELVVQTDAQALRSIADNLIENAAKYAPSGTRIAIAVIKGSGGWRLTVTDEGPGVPMDDRARIFERFYRGGNEETRLAKGTGLGLYIVQRLAHRLGGEVRVGQAVPHGAIFAASFPDR